MLSNASKFWTWIVVSSADPSQVATTVQGFFSLAVVQSVFSLLSLLGLHFNFTLNVLGGDAYSIIYSVLTAISAIIGTYGAIMKVYRSLVGSNAAMSAFRASHGR